ncbi:AAEL012163-PA [Aedes aegypti]|uniref:AAEL012163-PA n=1 Tax=Aedes aegypti TaxID=7159 RepID=Q16MW5_AEDAE|nr:AAEL012163-PA [Aedes aegypti]
MVQIGSKMMRLNPGKFQTDHRNHTLRAASGLWYCCLCRVFRTCQQAFNICNAIYKFIVKYVVHNSKFTLAWCRN